MMLQYFAVKLISFFCGVTFTLDVAPYFWLKRLIADVQNDVNRFNKIAKSKRNQTQKLKQLRYLIRFHSTVKKLSIILLGHTITVSLFSIYAIALFIFSSYS